MNARGGSGSTAEGNASTGSARADSTQMRWILLIGVWLLVVMLVAGALNSAGAMGVAGVWLTDGPLLLVWLLAWWGFGRMVVGGRAFEVSASNVTTSGSGRALIELSRVAIGFGLSSVMVLGLGLVGWVGQAWGIGLLAVGAGHALFRMIRSRAGTGSTAKMEAGENRAIHGAWWWGLLLAVPAGMMVVGSSLFPGVLWRDEPHGYDVLSYHLMAPREWLEAGRIEALRHNVFSFFPMNVEMQHLWAMQVRDGAWAGMYLSQMQVALLMMLVVVSVYATARAWGSGRAVAMLASVGAAWTPWTVMLGSVAYNEAGGALLAVISIAWAGIARRERVEWSESKVVTRAMVCAGVCAGLAAGCKMTFAPMLAIALPLLMWRRGGAGVQWDWIRRTIACGMIAMIALSPWLIRTAVWSGGNPVFPLAMGLFGQGHFDDGQVERFEVAHQAASDVATLEAKLDRTWSEVVLGWRFGVTIAVMLIGAAMCVVGLLGKNSRANSVSGDGLRLVIGAVGMLIVWIGFTHLQGRFLSHLVPMAWVVLACGAMSMRAATWLRSGVVGVMAFVAIVMLFVRGEVADRLSREEPLLFGLRDVRGWTEMVLLPEGASDEVLKSDAMVILVGDGAPFMWDIPMHRLRYRTVFDVPSGRASWIEAYLGKSSDRGAENRVIAIVSQSEIARLARTYRNLPAGGLGEVPPGVRVIDRP